MALKTNKMTQILFFGLIRAVSLVMGIAMIILGKDNGFWWFGFGMILFREIMIVWIQGLPEENNK